MLLRLCGTIVSIGLAFVIAQQVGMPVYDNMLKEGVHTAVGNAIVAVAEQVDGVEAEILNKDEIEKVIGEIKGDALAEFNFNIKANELDIKDFLKRLQADTDNQMLAGALSLLVDNTDAIGALSEGMLKSTKTVEQYICEDIVDPVASTTTKVIIFVVLSIIIKLILSILINFIESVMAQVGLSGLNRIVGGIIGTAGGLVIAYIVAIGIGLLADMQVQTEYFNRKCLEASPIGNALITFDITKAYTEVDTWYNEVLTNVESERGNTDEESN